MSPHANSALAPFVIPTSIASILPLVALLYLRGWFQLRVTSSISISKWRLYMFMGGLVSIAAAVLPPLAGLDHRLLCMHMVQHFLLMTIAPPLILLGEPFLSFRRGLPSPFIRFVMDPVLGSKSTQQLAEFMCRPLTCWLIATAVLLGWHFPRAFDLVMQSETWHAIEKLSFLAAGLLFWMPVIRPWPSTAQWPQWSIPAYLFLATLPCDALSAFLTFCGRVVYPHYLHQQLPLNISPLEDQETAGAMMWVFVTFAYVIPAAVATIQLLSPSPTYFQPDPSDGSAGLEEVAVQPPSRISVEPA
jgi:putative membrane protein